MARPRRLFAIPAVLTLAVSLTFLAPGAQAQGWQGKVSPWVLRATAGDRTASFLVVMSSSADLSLAAALPTKDAKGRFVFDTLRAHADRTQAGVRALLDARHVAYRPRWIVNLVSVVRGDRELVRTLASRSDVARIESNGLVRSSLVSSVKVRLAPAAPDGTAWNVKKVKAPQLWANGFRGEGMTIGDIDTGFKWDHPALKTHYRGWNGATADHNYNWYDEIDPSNRAPFDPNGHGTATVGTAIGNDGATNRIGVAPGARWIGCRAMDPSGEGTPDTYMGCLEFMVAPFDLDGQNPDPSKAPVAVNNSWFCSLDDGECPSQDVLLPAVQDVRAAGIVPVVAAGNSGPDCGTIGEFGPPAQYDESFTVGAITNENSIASFSSRGPATFQGMRIKPDIVAPGQDVRSSWPPNQYAFLSGTSMAAPHLVGVIALLWQAKPSLLGDVDATERLLDSTATHLLSSDCSSSGSWPNNVYGSGLVDAARAAKP